MRFKHLRNIHRIIVVGHVIFKPYYPNWSIIISLLASNDRNTLSSLTEFSIFIVNYRMEYGLLLEAEAADTVICVWASIH